jgi:hypothetical protein
MCGAGSRTGPRHNGTSSLPDLIRQSMQCVGWAEQSEAHAVCDTEITHGHGAKRLYPPCACFAVLDDRSGGDKPVHGSIASRPLIRLPVKSCAPSWPGLSRPSTTFFFGRKANKAWMPGSSPGMTAGRRRGRDPSRPAFGGHLRMRFTAPCLPPSPPRPDRHKPARPFQ